MDRPDLEDDERSATATARCQNIDFLAPIINEYLGGMTREEAVKKLNMAGVPCGPVNTAEDIFSDAHVRARGMLIAIDDPEVGRFEFARTTPYLSAAPKIPTNPAPNLGQHTRQVLQELLGYSPDEVSGLAADGVVGTDDA